MRLIVAGLFGLAAGIALHWFLPPIARRAEPSAGAPAPAASARQTCEVDWIRMRGEVGSAVHTALVQSGALSRPPADRTTTAAADKPVPTEPSAEQVHARTEQVELLKRALDEGTWTQEHAIQLRQLLAVMTLDDRRKAMSSVSMAINDGKLKLKTPEPF
jgi:hypothetical protein